MGSSLHSKTIAAKKFPVFAVNGFFETLRGLVSIVRGNEKHLRSASSWSKLPCSQQILTWRIHALCSLPDVFPAKLSCARNENLLITPSICINITPESHISYIVTFQRSNAISRNHCLDYSLTMNIALNQCYLTVIIIVLSFTYNVFQWKIFGNKPSDNFRKSFVSV